MKTATLTFHASHNYGSMLQAYALQQVLLDWGVENEIINLRTVVQRSLIPSPLQLNHPRSSLIKLLRFPNKTFALQSKYFKFELFMRKYLHLSPELKDKAAVEKYLVKRKFNALIVGSDQIWNSACWDFDTAYLLDFPLSFKRIAYAPSLGSFPEKITLANNDLFKRLWLKFDNLSTRELSGSDFVQMHTGREVSTVLDPTLLLNRDGYDKLCKSKRIVKEQYIFYYTPREESGTFRIAQLLADELKLKIVVTQDYNEYTGDNVISIMNCGPCEFLNIIKYADYTIGKSFHLLAFSLIFRKEFLMVSRNEDSRFLNLLQKLDITNRTVSPDCLELELPERIDYNHVYTILDELRQGSLNYLRCALGIDQ